MKRSVGYCEYSECEDYAKGVFLLNHGPNFYCPRCKKTGEVIPERAKTEGETGIYKEVRVEYNYDPIQRKFREVAIVRDEAIWGPGKTYLLMSPMIRTDRRALKVAEALLANLQLVDQVKPGDIVATRELVLDLDSDRFKEELDMLGRKWGEAPRADRRP